MINEMMDQRRQSVSAKSFDRRKFLMIYVLMSVIFCGQSAWLCAEKKVRMSAVIVNEGDTLWRIAFRLMKDPMRWPEIVKYNPALLKDQLIVLPGTKLVMPSEMVMNYFGTAKIVDMQRDVWYKSRENSTWLYAYRDMAIYDRDSLKTAKESEAQVQFKNKDLLILQKDSMVILNLESGKEEINLLKGEALMRASSIKLVTPTVTVISKKEQTFYKARVRQDEATTVQVEDGQTEVTSLDTGKSVIVSGGFSNITRHNENPSHPIVVPPLPELKLSKQINSKSLPSEQVQSEHVKTKQPKPESEALKITQLQMGEMKPDAMDPVHANSEWEKYRLQIASDDKFRHIEREYLKNVVPGKLVMDIEEEYQLPDGAYFRRVAYNDGSGSESKFYQLPALVLTTRNPVLSLEIPEDGLKTKNQFVRVEGKSEPGIILTVNGLPVEIRPDGSFIWAVVLKKNGANKIQVVAKDLKENKSVLERTVHYAGQ